MSRPVIAYVRPPHSDGGRGWGHESEGERYRDREPENGTHGRLLSDPCHGTTGTVVAIDVLVTVSQSAGPRSTRTRLFVVGEVTKLVPEIVTAVPAGAMVGRSP